MTETSERFPGHIAQPDLAKKIGASSSAVARVAANLNIRKVYMPPAFGKNTGPVRIYSPTEAKRITTVIEEKQKAAPNRWPNRPRPVSPAEPATSITTNPVPFTAFTPMNPINWTLTTPRTTVDEMRDIRLLLERLCKVWNA